MANWWIGCSGFYYKHWRERFYPKGLPQRKWFEYYCEFFKTVELNVTFYRFPKREDLKGWYNRSPQDFRFAVKAPRLISHYKKFNNAVRETREFYDAISSGLGEKLGCVLFQLPPTYKYTEQNLTNILSTIDPAYANVVEFRHLSWWDEKVYEIFKKSKTSFCGISYPEFPDQVIQTAPTLYYRFHGVPKLYLSSYTAGKMRQTRDDILHFRSVKDVYIYFNNDIDVHAISNARQLVELIRS